ncbi:MAG TPA: hypothetical protein VMY05_02465 [Acidobacteriota bacterium]|nr:hypothetical protein [Acidobacteriota bacterium]
MKTGRGRLTGRKGLRTMWRFDPEESRHFFLLYCAGLAVTLVVLFWKFIISDRMLFGNDILSYGIFHRTLLRDYFVAHGGIPPWNPYILCGLPFVDAIHGGALYPLTIIDFCGNMFRMIGYNFILHYFLAGVFTYLAARQLRLSKLGAAMAGLSYALAPCLISWVAAGHDGKLYSAAFFPLVVLFLDRLFERRRILDAAMLGLVYGIIILTPHLQMAYYVLWFIVIYSVYKLVGLYLRSRSIRASAAGTALVVAAVALGLCVSAVQFLPSYTYIPNHTPRATSSKGYKYASLFSLRAEEAFSQIVPEFCGLDDRNGPRRYWGKAAFKDNSESVGTVTLFVALLAFLTRGRRRKYFWGGLAVATFLYAMGPATPLLRLVIAVVPYADAMEAPSTSAFIFVFSVAVLSGLAVQSVREGRSPERRRIGRAFPIVLWGVPVILLAATVLFSLFGEDMLMGYSKVFHPSIIPTDEATPAKWSKAVANLPNLKHGLWLATFFVGLGALLIHASLKGSRLKHLLWLIPVVVIVADSSFDRRFIRLFNQDRFSVGLPLAEIIADQDVWGRTTGFGSCHHAFQLGYYGIESHIGVHGKEPVWYHGFIGEYSGWNYFHPRVINLTGTRYIVCRASDILPPDTMGPVPLDTIGRFERYVVLENRNAFPLAYLVSRYEVMPTRKHVYHEVILGQENLREIVYLEEEPELAVSPQPDDTSWARVTHRGIDSVEVSVSCTTNKLLVLTDTYYDAWHAFVDGVERRIYMAYGAFRAVEVPAGSRKVVFTYYSSMYELGKALTLAGLLIVLAVLVLNGLQSLRRKARPGHSL